VLERDVRQAYEAAQGRRRPSALSGTRTIIAAPPARVAGVDGAVHTARLAGAAGLLALRAQIKKASSADAFPDITVNALATFFAPIRRCSRRRI